MLFSTMKDSPLYKAHPSIKIISILAINLIAFFMETPAAMFLLFLTILVAYPLFRVKITILKRYWYFIVILVQAVSVSYLLGSKIPPLNPGGSIYYQFPWETFISQMTIVYAITMIMRFVSMLLGSTLFISTMDEKQIRDGFHSLRIPFSLAFLISLSFRTMFLFLTDMDKIRNAMTLRGVRFSSGPLMGRINAYTQTFIPLMVIGLRRITHITFALETKGFRSGKRSNFREQDLKFKKRHYLIVAIEACLIIAAYILRYWFGILSFPGWPFVPLPISELLGLIGTYASPIFPFSFPFT